MPIEGLLLRHEGGQLVTLIVGSAALRLRIEDIVALERLPLPSGYSKGIVEHVRLSLETRALLIDASLSEAYDEHVRCAPMPFAWATRHECRSMESPQSFRDLEREYYQRHFGGTPSS